MSRQLAIRSALQEATAALQETIQRRDEAATEAERLQREVEGLRIALGAYEPEPQTERLFSRVGTALLNGAVALTEAQQRAEVWRDFPRTEAIERVYAEVQKPLHRKELVTQLHRRGRTDDIRDVSAALAYLKRVGKAKSLGEGRWMVRVPSPASSSPDLAQGGGHET